VYACMCVLTPATQPLQGAGSNGVCTLQSGIAQGLLFLLVCCVCCVVCARVSCMCLCDYIQVGLRVCLVAWPKASASTCESCTCLCQHVNMCVFAHVRACHIHMSYTYVCLRMYEHVIYINHTHVCLRMYEFVIYICHIHILRMYKACHIHVSYTYVCLRMYEHVIYIYHIHMCVCACTSMSTCVCLRMYEHVIYSV